MSALLALFSIAMIGYLYGCETDDRYRDLQQVSSLRVGRASFLTELPILSGLTIGY